MKVEITESEEQPLPPSPREALAQWANSSAEWTRRIVRHILASDGPISESEHALIYRLLLEENQIDVRTLQPEPQLSVSAQTPNQAEPFFLTRLTDVKGVNALVEDSVIDFGPGLTLLFGENGTGKTGYARILKNLAGSRSVDEILPDIHLSGTPPRPSADIGYTLGSYETTLRWNGARGQFPFTLMSVFDSPSVRFHIDEDLGYTYRPAALAIFDRATDEVREIQKAIEEELQKLKPNNAAFLSRFNPLSSTYSMVQSVNSATDLVELRKICVLPDDVAEQESELRVDIARLVAGTLPQEIRLLQRVQKSVQEANDYGVAIGALKISEYNEGFNTMEHLQNDLSELRHTLFAAAGLPAEPDETWESFVRAGWEYKERLESKDVHDQTRCLYCRQLLSHDAVQLISKYGEYLEGKIAKDIDEQQAEIKRLIQPFQQTSLSTVRSYLEELEMDEAGDTQIADDRLDLLKGVVEIDDAIKQQLNDGVLIDDNMAKRMSGFSSHIGDWASELTEALEELSLQNSNHEEILQGKQKELVELLDRKELANAWADIEHFVETARRSEMLSTQKSRTSNILQRITLLANKSSEQLVNSNFKCLFDTECEQLRVPALQLEFFGREGNAQRRKKLPGGNKPSRVLSEGEQRSLAIADFIAEVKMSEQRVPVVFDDPVSSLDYRRLGEVAARIADLAKDRQVVVFSHDIFFVCSLLALLETSGGCVYYQVTDEDGNGTVNRGTGPRWDTVSKLTGKVNETIQKAGSASGEDREHLIREGYSWIRSWCEVFVEREVLAQVTERYQPNVRMMALDRIKISVFDDTRKTVKSVFERACRYMEGHSQPLPILSITPTLTELEADWKSLRDCRSRHDKAAI